MSPVYYRDSSGVIAVFDLSSVDSYEEMKHCIADFHDHHATEVHIAVTGNKLDLIEKDNNELVNEAKSWTESQGPGYSFHICSAATGEGVNELFEWVAEAIYGLGLPAATTIVAQPVPTEDKSTKSGCC